MKEINEFKMKDKEILRERKKEKEYAPIPFDLKIGDEIIAFDTILNKFSVFIVEYISEHTFTARDKEIPVSRGFQKFDYMHRKILRRE